MNQYEKYTDEKLIEMLRKGEDDVMEYILEKYKPLVRKKTNAMYLIGGESDDLIQEGMIGLFKAIRGFDANKEAAGIEIKAGFVEGKVVALEEIKAMAKVPSKETLYAMLAGGLNATIAGLARAINAVKEKQEAEA